MSRVGGGAGLQGERHYVESSGSDLMIFFSTMPDVRCDVPFSERVDDRDSIIGLLASLGKSTVSYANTLQTNSCASTTYALTSQPIGGRCGIGNVQFL